MSLIPPPPIGEPESLGELSRLVSFSLQSISASLDALAFRLDQVVTRDQHNADKAAMVRDIEDLKSEMASIRAEHKSDRDGSANTVKWAIGSVLSVLAIIATIWLALSGN